MDAGLKYAHVRQCQQCRYRFTRHATIARWPFCDANGGLLSLDDAHMEGDEGNCPAGYWRGLELVDLAAEAVTRNANKFAKAVETYARIIDAAVPSGAAEADVEGAVDRLLAAGVIRDEAIATEVALDVNARRTVDPLPRDGGEAITR